MILDKNDVDIVKLESGLTKLTALASTIELNFGEFEFVIQISIPLFRSKWEDNWREQWIAIQEYKAVDYPKFNGIKVVPVAGWFDNKIHLRITKKSEYK